MSILWKGKNAKTQFVRWTPKGLMILSTASDRDFRKEITANACKDHEPAIGRLKNATEFAHKKWTCVRNRSELPTTCACPETAQHCPQLCLVL